MPPASSKAKPAKLGCERGQSHDEFFGIWKDECSVTGHARKEERPRRRQLGCLAMIQKNARPKGHLPTASLVDLVLTQRQRCC